MLFPKILFFSALIFCIDGIPTTSKDQIIHTIVNVHPGMLTIDCMAPLNLKAERVLFLWQINSTEGFKVYFIVVESMDDLNIFLRL